MNRVTARKTLYLVGGPMGVGKSTVCRELNRMLPRSVLLDGDWVMHERAIVEELLARLPIAECGAQVRWVSLVASEEELRGRIERDVDAGLREAAAVERALAYLPLYRELGSELVDTTGRSPREVAELVTGRRERFRRLTQAIEADAAAEPAWDPSVSDRDLLNAERVSRFD